MDDFEHKFTRRKFGHDYCSPCLYHLILKKRQGAPVFSRLVGDPRIAPGSPGGATVEFSDLGIIIHEEICNLPHRRPEIQIYQYVIMPDHVHILLRVKRRLPRALGFVIGGLKTGIRKRWNSRKAASLVAPADDEEIFEENFTDRIIHPGRSLDAVFRYIRENPHRLAIRRCHPDFFRRIRNLRIEGKEFCAYGNLFNLRNPFKSVVRIHRRNTREENERLHEGWMEEAASGGVLVSPFIAPLEKKAYREAVAIGGRIIHIQMEAFGERYKPAETEFRLCSEGRLLLIAPAQTMGERITQEICMTMNRIAEAITRGDFYL